MPGRIIPAQLQINIAQFVHTLIFNNCICLIISASVFFPPTSSVLKVPALKALSNYGNGAQHPSIAPTRNRRGGSGLTANR